MQMLKRFSFSLLIVALILSCYAVPEVAAEGSDHVTMSKGDGYSLYNGVKLPSLPEWDKSVYPYAFVYFTAKGNARLFIVTGLWSALKEDYTMAESYGVYSSYKVEGGLWAPINIDKEYDNEESLLSSPMWANYDVPTCGELSTTYLAASDPIPLDGMNVIEWDGDTTGLVKVNKFYHVSNATDVDVDKVFARVMRNSTGIYEAATQTFFKVAGGYSMASHGRYAPEANDRYSAAGVYLTSDETVQTTLFAYYPIEETAVDYTFTYTTEHGTAPETKTVTVNAGESYTLTDVDLPTLSADGYVFKGWTANGVPVFAGNTIDGDIHLVASWELEPVPDPPEDPDPPQPPPDEEPDGNGIEAVKALIDAVVGVMQIEFTLWGFTFTFWQMMLFGIFVYIASWFIGGFFND